MEISISVPFFFLLCIRVYLYAKIGWILQRKGWELMGWVTCFLCQKIRKEERDNVGICSLKLPQIEYKERKKFYGKKSLTTAEHPYP